MRPVLRGGSWTDAGLSSATADTLQESGLVEMAAKQPRSEGPNSKLYVGWIAATVMNVLESADRVRAAAGFADAE